jgi:hypothetical protein
VAPCRGKTLTQKRFDLEARVGIEPTNEAFAEPCLTTWLPRLPSATEVKSLCPVRQARKSKGQKKYSTPLAREQAFNAQHPIKGEVREWWGEAGDVTFVMAFIA